MKRIIPCVIITLALILAGSFLPVLGVAGLMLCPLPLCVLGCLEGQKNMSVAELMIEVTLFLVVSPSMAAYFLLGCAPLSASIFSVSREDIKNVKKFTGPESLLICTAASIIFKLILVASFWFFTGRNIFMPDVQQMNLIMYQLYGDQPELLAAVGRVFAILPYMMPSMLVIYAAAETYMNYSICRSIINKFFPKVKNFPPELPEFKLWRFPISLLFASVFGFILGWFIDIDTWFSGAMFIMNLQIAANVFMFVEGLSMVFWIMAGFKFKKGAKIAACILLSIPFFWPWLIVIGMCDMALNLRERIKFKQR